MNNDKFDPYGLSEIDKIQEEIERDLKQAWPQESGMNEITETSDAPKPIEYTPQDFEPPAEYAADEIPAAEVLPVEVLPAETAPQPFYQETIKHAPAPYVPRKYRSWRRTVAVVCLVCTLGTGTLGAGIGAAVPLARHYLLGGGNETYNNSMKPAYDIESSRYVFSDASGMPPREGTLSDVVKLVEPSVVGVAALYERASSGGFSRQQTSDASGIIFAEDETKVYVATNYHVLSGAASTKVSLGDAEAVPATLLGRDADADLAVLALEKKDLLNAGIHSITLAVFGDSDAMEVGDVVLAIGNAMGEGNSATSGIISKRARTIPTQNRKLTVLQTDAAINPGNSGGPLINARGEVIGINTVNLTPAESYFTAEGMGYSIASNAALPILEELLRAEPKPFLGIRGATVSEEIAEMFDIPPIGVWVDSVFDTSSADMGGIQRTDIITSFNGNAIFTMEQLQEEIKKCRVGDTVEIKILREGRTPLTLVIDLGADSPDNY